MSRLLVIGCGGVASVAIRKMLSEQRCFYRDYDRKQDKGKMRCNSKRRLKYNERQKLRQQR